MEKIVTRFVSALRERGVRVSPGESLDAVRAIALGGFEGRESARALLRLTLVKNVSDIPTFEELFDEFFSSYPSSAPAFDPFLLMEEALVQMEVEELDIPRPEPQHDEDPIRVRVSAKVTADDLKELQSLREVDSDQNDGSEIVVQVKGFRGKADAPSPTRFAPKGPPVSVSFHCSWSPEKAPSFTPEELAAMQEVVSRMVTRLHKEVRRMKERQTRGRLHVIKTIQKNYRNGMVPFLVELRRKQKEKPRVVVLCDVSFSVSHASRFMLLLLHTLHNRLMEVRSFIFNSEIAEITDLLTDLPVNVLLETIDNGKIIDLEENSNFGKVFLSFKNKYLENLRGKPAVIVLGDGRNNYNDSNSWVLDEIREKAGYLLWLTPEEKETWFRGDCLMEEYGSYCDKVEVVKNVDELSRVVEELFRNYYLESNLSSARQRREEKKEEVYDYQSYYTRGQSTQAQFDPEVRRRW